MKRIIELNYIHLELDPAIPVISHWHNLPQLIFSLDGVAEVHINDQTFSLHAEEFLIVDSYTLHRISSCTGHIACLLLNYDRFSKRNGSAPGLHFSCRPDNDNHKTAYQNIRKALSHLLYYSISPDPNAGLSVLSAEHLIFSELISGFSFNKDVVEHSLSTVPHVQNAIRYMSEHFRESITVSSAAAACHVTDTYLNHLFRDHLEMTPVDFLTQIRLEDAMTLLPGKNTLTRIAETSGFPNLRSFNHAFRKKYHCLPAQYRQTMEETLPDHNSTSVESAITRIMNQYLAPGIREQTRTLPALAPSAGDSLPPAPHLEIFHFGIASFLLNTSVRKEIEEDQKIFHFTDIYLTSLLDDHLVRHMFHEDRILWDFTFLDEILDFVLGIGLKPFLHLNSIPEILSPTEQIYHFGYSNVSIPEDLEKWEECLESLLIHLTSRYGETELKQWHVCFWSFQDEWMNNSNQELLDKALGFIRNSCGIIRRICPSIPLSGPYTGLSACDASFHFMKQYLQDCAAHNSLPDFLAFRILARSSAKADADGWNTYGIELSTDYYRSLFQDIINLSQCVSPKKLPIYISIMNGSSFNGDLMNDTVFAAALHAAALSISSGYGIHLGSMYPKDHFLHSSFPVKEFSGGLGLRTIHGIPKAVWYADWLLQKLQGKQLYIDDNAVVTCDGEKLQLLLFYSGYIGYRILQKTTEGNAVQIHNNLRFLKEQCREPLFPDPRKRYTEIPAERLLLRIPFTGLKNGTYRKTEYILNRTYGSAFDHWVLCGGEEPDEEQISYLKRIAFPLSCHGTLTVTGKTLIIERLMEPGEIYYTEIVRSPSEPS